MKEGRSSVRGTDNGGEDQRVGTFQRRRERLGEQGEGGVQTGRPTKQQT